MGPTTFLAFAVALCLANPVTSSMAAIGDSAAQELLDGYALFRWETNHSFAKESFAFQLNESSNLQVTDFKRPGDMFDVYDNSKWIGRTSLRVYDGNKSIYASTPQKAMVDDRFSKGVFHLEKGSHNITIMAYGPHETGSAALRLTQRTNLILAKRGDTVRNSKYQEEEEENIEVSGRNRVFLRGKIDTGAQRPEKNQKLEQPHRVNNHVAPKTITHWKIARETAVPYAKRVTFEAEDDYNKS